MGVYQARAAMAVAKMAGAEQYAAQAWEKAQGLLRSAETDSASRKGSVRKQATGLARQAVQAAEDARSIAVKRADEARVEAERQAAADREAEAAAAAKASVEAANAQRVAAEKNAEEAAQRADAARQQTELAQQQAAAAAKATAQADAARAAAFAAEQKANAAAAAALSSKEQLRAQLLARFNEVLPTEDSPRGLVVNLGGVNFASGKADLTVEAQVKLARFSGLIAPYPDLKIDVEGYTDNTGAPAFNMKLSQDRASAVRDYLIQQGVKPDSISAKGLGDAGPIAPNTTSEGRARNRRVEIVVSGEVIGTKLGQ
jgi:outer membrane protein OmpA-like peptidoglycan-associated protein